MAFAPTPARMNAPSQLLSLPSLLAAGGNGDSGGEGVSGSVTISSPPSTGSVGIALSIVGTVSPNGSAVQVGLSGSSEAAPTGWVPATVTGGGWIAELTPSSPGTFYLWAKETNTPSVETVTDAVTISNVAQPIAFTDPPTTGTPGTALLVAGTVSTAGSAVQVGLSTSTTTAPTGWVAASVSGMDWTAAVTPSAAGTYYLWAEQTGTPSLQAISGAVVVSAGGSALTYSLISGSGNGSLTGTILSNTSYLTTDWTSTIAHGATDVAPNVQPSSMGAIAASKFWFDTSATSTAIPSSNYGNNASVNNGVVSFYPASYFSTPTGVPAAPSTPGTYYGKYAMYDADSNLLGIYVTSAISVV